MTEEDFTFRGNQEKMWLAAHRTATDIFTWQDGTVSSLSTTSLSSYHRFKEYGNKLKSVMTREFV